MNYRQETRYQPQPEAPQNKQPTSFDAYACAVLTGVLASMGKVEIERMTKEDAYRLTNFSMDMAETCISVKRDRVVEIRKRATQ